MSIRTACAVTLVALSALALGAADAEKKVEITGKGHRFFAADYDKKVMGIVAADGSIEWSKPMDGGTHDAWMMPDGKILWTPSNDKVYETDPKTNEQVLVYDARKNGNDKAHVQLHGIQPNADGSLVIFESGPKRVIEVDRSGKLLKEVKLPIDKGDPHHHMRNARKLENGNYLLTLSADSKVVEVDPTGKVVWEVATKGEAYSAIRLKNGNTLIGNGYAHRVFEVDKDGKEVWSIGESELPGIKLGYVAQLQRLPNGNTVITNCHAGPANPQLIEVDQDKKVVWSFRDHEHFGNALPVSIILDTPGVLR
jgi:outer membrane protein assembly factor BamB